MTKKSFLILITLIAYLPLAVANVVPDIAVAQHSDSVSESNMTSCHEPQPSHTCGHCSEQHHCNTALSSCSIILGIAPHSYGLNLNQNSKSQYATFQVSAVFQQPIPIFRPPISL